MGNIEILAKEIDMAPGEYHTYIYGSRITELGLAAELAALSDGYNMIYIERENLPPHIRAERLREEFEEYAKKRLDKGCYFNSRISII